MTIPVRPRGACPSLAAPMPTGDGLLVRLGAGAHWTPDTVIRLADAAARWGNGAIEVTARGSWQVRGLRPDTAASFAEAVADLGGEAAVAVDPLAGLVSAPGLQTWTTVFVSVLVQAAPFLVFGVALSAATGARFALLPPDNSTGNFVKVTQRVPVKIALDKVDPEHPLRAGMSVTATVAVK